MAPLLKDNVNAAVVELLAERAAEFEPDFPVDRFVKRVAKQLPELELKDRINLIADELAADLSDDYPTALATVVAMAGSDGIEEWSAWPLCSFVERHGVDHPEESLQAMETLTIGWSCEFAIRPFLQDHMELTRTYLRRWVHHEHESVRRLPSEGTRPLLPWGPKVAAIIDDPMIGIELLTELRHDPSETVRRSVANHLNDVAKANPDLVISVLGEWSAGSPPVDERMVRHALRTLIKQGNPGALQLLGFTTEPEVTVIFSTAPDTAGLGDHLELHTTITSTSKQAQRLAVDFVIHHVNANGKTSPKVFKWTTVELEPGEQVELSKRRLLQTASTRSYHSGRHEVELQLAGRIVASDHFEMDAS